MLPPGIRSRDDLVTSHAATCEGFLSQALAKTEKANPYVLRAHELWRVLKDSSSIQSVAHHRQIRGDLLSAAGFSEKARSHLTAEELESALERVLQTVTVRTPDAWREEILYRYLLTRGDSLGGAMRNITGALGAKRLADAVDAALHSRNISAHLTRSANDPDKAKAVEWAGRLLLFDVKPSFLGKSVDVILLDTRGVAASPARLKERMEGFVACGELKAGIDPAGADEHWKTARSALERIRERFRGTRCPALFFVGAAIEAAMATEVFEQLQDGRLTYAANLTVREQVHNLALWLVSL